VIEPPPLITDLGPWLSHYTTAEAALGHILPTGKLRMSPYERMRDPFENKYVTLAMGYAGDPPEPERAWADAMNQVNRLRSDMRVLSFTRDAVGDYAAGGESHNGCCWARPRMWEQYAENHAGVCLIFDREQVEHQLAGELNAIGPHYRGEVTYTPAGFYGSPARIITHQDFVSPDRSTRANAITRHIEDHHKDFFFLKTLDWATEYEYRFLLLQPDRDDAYVAYGHALKFVVVGERFPEWQLPAAEAACLGAGLELKRMTWESGWPYPAKTRKQRRRELLTQALTPAAPPASQDTHGDEKTPP
jgi:Protein of unknown function (DUF2971)